MTHVEHTEGGSISVTDAALSQIILRSAEAVDGVRVRRRPRRRLGIEIEGRRAHVELGLGVAYGRVLPEAARDVQQEVTDALGRMCGLEVRAVDVTVEELDH